MLLRRLSHLLAGQLPSAILFASMGASAPSHNAKASSFGRIARLRTIIRSTISRRYYSRIAGLGALLRADGCRAHISCDQTATNLLGPDLLALLIMIGFGIVVLSSPNREIRFAFPAIVALPFLTGILMSGKGHSVRGPSAALAAGLVFCGLLAAGVPTRHRANRQSLSRCDAVLAQAAGCNAQRIILATDSPTLNQDLMDLALEVSPKGPSVKVGTLSFQAISGVPIEADFRAMSQADEVVFQDRDALSPPFTNQRVPEYERYVRQVGYVPIRVGVDVSVYSKRCGP